MGLADKVKQDVVTKNNMFDKDELTKEEYEFLFAILKEVNFKGHQVESLYNLVIKLQKKYLNLVNSK